MAARRALLLALLVTAPAAAEIRVQQAGDLISLQATAAPVNDVLDRLARQTGMQVVYEGAPPRLPVTLAIERRSVAEAVFSLLDGLGLNYALRLDERGARVVTLVMAGAAAAGPGHASDAARAGQPLGAVPPYPPPPSYPQEGVEEYDEGVIPPPPPQPPQEFVVAQPQPEPQQPQIQQQFTAPALGSGFSSPFGGGGFSTPSVFGAPTAGTPATPPPQFVPEPAPPEEKEP